ncbi:TonB-dependent receptor [Cupriavidus agavae]|nr:TonB-dependent receptor [Cupriavidus agavae]
MVIAAFSALPAFAEPGADQATNRDGRNGDVATLPAMTVTARKSEEAPLDVPQSVTVIDSDSLGAAPLDPQAAIVQGSANVVWNTWSGAQGFFAVRGISSLGAPVNNADGTVAFNIDGVPTSMLGLSSPTLDVRQVEVLRGPQGTLWGSNALGGAINVTTNRPDGERDFHVKTEVGSHGYRLGEAVMGGNLIPDALDGRLAVQVANSNGDINSLATDRLGQRDVRGARGGLRWHDGTNSVSVTGFYAKDRGNAPFFLLKDSSGFPVSGTMTMPTQDTQRGGTIVKIEHAFDSATLTSITSFQQNRVSNYVDATDSLVYAEAGIPAAFLTSTPGFTDDKENLYYQEIRLNSLAGGPVRWVAGGSASYSDAERHWGNGLQQNPTWHDTRLKTRSFAMFGDATIPFGNQWSLSLGGRLNNDAIDMDVRNIQRFPGASGHSDTSQTYLTGRMSLAYTWSPVLMSYASVSRGHAMRIYSLYGTAANGALADPYPAATGITYEFGTKVDLFDKRLQLDGGVFLNEIKNGVLTYLDPASATFRTSYQDYRTTGFELQARALVVRGLTLSGSVGYTHAELRDDSFATSRVPNIPSWTATASLQYAFPAQAFALPGSFSIAADYRYVSSRVADVDRSFSMAPYSIANAALSWQSPGGALQVSLFARNLTDKRYYTYGSSLNAIPIVTVGQGRVLGAGATIRF